MTITVLYSCPPCGLKKVPVAVPAREQEDVKTWMDQTVAAVMKDHQRRSPMCRPKELHDLMIPITGADKIGGPPIQ